MGHNYLIKPKAVSVFMGLLIAALMRLVWRWLIGLPVVDALGLTAICLAAFALLYLMITRSKTRTRNQRAP